ncbi:carbonic anhydrase [Streptomyces sp. NPDC048606]|uniref:carbonic anhydrase n=1 Tax=Streptomyces sp. NPDC048606 TaxID=3154726 RepID=UPI003419B6B2
MTERRRGRRQSYAMQRITAGARGYRARATAAGAYLPGLARGPRPDVLIICCSDPRLHPALITGSLPGQTLELRTPGAAVPHPDTPVLTQALAFPSLRDIVVLGHSDCDDNRPEPCPPDEAGHNGVALHLAALGSHPTVESRVTAGRLRLHGWYHDLTTGTTSRYQPGTGTFTPL